MQFNAFLFPLIRLIFLFLRHSFYQIPFSISILFHFVILCVITLSIKLDYPPFHLFLVVIIIIS